jgi:hypothetical protein
MWGDSIQENKNQPTHKVLTPDQLMAVKGDYVPISAAYPKDLPKMVSSLHFQAEPIIFPSETFKAIPVVNFD